MKKLLVVLFLLNNTASFAQEVHYIHQNLYQYLFNQNSYWVYENDSTFKVDTIILTKVTHEFELIKMQPGPVPYYFSEHYYCNLISKNQGSSLFQNFMGYFISNSYHYYDIIYFYSTIAGESAEDAKFIGILDTLKIDSNEFHKVKVINNYGVNYYWVEKIGLVRIDSLIGNKTVTWNLKSWKVNMYSDIKSIDNQYKGLQIYPNPCNERIVIDLKKSNYISAIAIYNFNGKFIDEIGSIWSDHYEYNTSDLQPGLYLMKVSTSDSVYYSKFFKSR